MNCNQVREGSHVVYVDESIVFGSEKNLLILGFPTHKTPLDRSVSDSDVEVLYVGISDSWRGESVAVELGKINKNTPIINIFSCVSWAKNLLSSWETLPVEVRERLVFLQEQQGLIDELSEQHFIFTCVCELLKNKGFSAVTKSEIKERLSGFGKSKNAQKFVAAIGVYLDTLSESCDSLALENCVCSSDIIEVFFCKFNRSGEPPKNQP